MDLTNILPVSVTIMNLIAFVVMGIDKRKARLNAWRTPEKLLFILAIAGGAVGIWAGMRVFKHKTRKLKFSLGVPAIFIVQVSALVLYYIYLA